MGFSRQEYWSGSPFPSPGDLPNPEIKPRASTLQANSSPAEPQEAEVLWRPTRTSGTNTQKENVLFIIGDWNAKVGSQEIPEVTGKSGLGIQNEAGQRLIEFGQENPLVIASTLFQQHKRRLYTHRHHRWSTPKSDWLYSLQLKMEKLYTVSKNNTRSWLWLRSWTYYQIQT